MTGTLVRWDPFSELIELRGRFDRMFEDVGHTETERAWTPAIDVMRENGSLLVRADVPGIKPEEVKIEVEDNVLTVTGTHEAATEEKGTRYVRRERRYGSFARSIALPPGVDPKAIKATTHDGIVEVTIPLPEPVGKERIQITPTAV